jgi:hypothetical protein
VEEEEIKSKLFLIFFPLLLFNQEISVIPFVPLPPRIRATGPIA